MIFGMLTYFYSPFDVDFRWILLILFVTVISRYTSIATVVDFYTRRWRRDASLMDASQSSRLYFFFQGSVAFSLVTRMRGELLETMNVGLMIRLMLFMIWFSTLEIIVVANPLTNRGYRRLSTDDTGEDASTPAERSTDFLFPYLVRMDTTQCPSLLPTNSGKRI